MGTTLVEELLAAAYEADLIGSRQFAGNLRARADRVRGLGRVVEAQAQEFAGPGTSAQREMYRALTGILPETPGDPREKGQP